MTPLVSKGDLGTDVPMTHNKAKFGLPAHQLQRRLNKDQIGIFLYKIEFLQINSQPPTQHFVATIL